MKPTQLEVALVGLALGLWLAVGILFGLLHGCATGPTLAPLPPLPGPNINDWQMHADGSAQ